jgi:hypothetical protein
MKKFLPFILAFFVVLTLEAQYVTPDTGVNWSMDDLVSHSNGVVTGSSGNYVIHSDLTISLNDTLTFLTGDCEIFCEQDVLITVQGVFLSFLEDLSGNTITFKGDEDYFKGFLFDGSNGSVMRNVVVNFAGGIKLIESDVYFRNCIFEGFNTENCTGAVDIFKSDPEFHLCSFVSNDGPAIKSAANAESAPLIDSCFIEYNVMTNVNMPQVNLGTTPPDDTIVISNCLIAGLPGNNMVGGIAVSTLAGGVLNAIIENTHVVECRYGIAVYGNNIFTAIRGNTLRYNTDSDPMQGGSGISYWGDETNVSVVSNNIIRDNLWGITILNKAKPNLGEVGDEESPGYNEIYDNGNDGKIYDVYNNTPGNIKAENNYWGTEVADSIEAHIYHHTDDAALGEVDYIPFLKPESIKKDRPQNDGFTIYPVPADDVVWVNFQNEGFKKLKVYTVSGAEVAALTSSRKKTYMDVSGLKNGVYILSVEKETGRIISRKLIVQH